MAYKLDYEIERDVERLQVIKDIIETTDTYLRPKDLDLMASYLLYGKDENGQNALQREGIQAEKTKFNSYRRKASKELSLDAILEAASNDAPIPQFKAPEKDVYKIAKPRIYPEDSELPGMAELQDAIARMEQSIKVAEGKMVPTREDLTPITNHEQLYKLKHILIDMRRHQYYIRDAYKPQIRLLGIFQPGRQYIDWSGPINAGGERYIEFDWENYKHVAALLRNYAAIRMESWDNPTGWETTLIMDFDRYYDMAQIEPIYDFIVTKRIDGIPHKQIAEEMEQKFGRDYGIAYISCLLSEHIPRRISLAAKRHRLELDKDIEKKECPHCHEVYPNDPVFFKKIGLCYKCYRRYKKWQERERV